MKQPTIPECRDNGEYNDKSDKCMKCKYINECKKIRLIIREQVTKRLGVGGSYRWLLEADEGRGESLSEEPPCDENRLLIVLEEYMITYAITDGGLTGLADLELYKKAIEAHLDLTQYINAMKELKRCDNVPDFETNFVAPIDELEEKYSKISGIKIYQNPSLLGRIIKREIYLKLVPKMLSYTSTVAALHKPTEFDYFYHRQKSTKRFQQPNLTRFTSRRED